MNLEARLKHYRLNKSEYELIERLLGRSPEGVEWALFSALWSEHCSYKSSRKHLGRFRLKSERVLESFGENAGVLDLGEGERVAFKMESHNHPSFIEPYQGAATGVGGILRDIFTMGARPIALADYLCFGEPNAPRMQSLVDGVVRGISGYGNCVGVPTITGRTEFHSSYNKNILVNAFALGLFRPGEPVVTSKAKGVGNLVVYVGAKTGRDGIHGASMASESFDSASEKQKPTVQIGDPFYEKLLIESCIEVMQAGLVVAIQDMGAAGLTSSSFEMAAKGGVGFDLHLDKVPLRDPTMTPEDILLSESQERMLMVVEPKNLQALREVFSRWELDAVEIGSVTPGPEVRLYWRGEVICKIDPRVLTDRAPAYDRAYDSWEPKNRAELEPKGVASKESGAEVLDSLKRVLLSPAFCSRDWIYRQYDQRVGALTVRDAASDVAILRLPDSGRALGIVLGLRPYLMRWDAFEGAKDAVAYPALQLASKFIRPLGVTDCLNFGNPERREIMSEFVASVEGIAQVCESLSTPVISGNVSFYNETLGQNITSTPSTGLVGLGRGVANLPACRFQGSKEKNRERPNRILLFTSLQAEFNGAMAELKGQDLKGQGAVEPKEVALMVEALCSLEEVGLLSSRVVGQFGLLGTLVRMVQGGVGATVELPLEFSDIWRERLYQVIVEVMDERCEQVKAIVGQRGIRVDEVGVVGGSELIIKDLIRIETATLSQWLVQGWRSNFEALA